MPRVCLVALSGFRIREPQMLELGMALPGLQARAGAVGALPALGLLTLAGMTPPDWEVEYHEAAAVDEALVQRILDERPTLVAISALTASIFEAYRLADRLRAAGVLVVLGGLHVTSCPVEAGRHADGIVVGDGEPVWAQVLADAATGELRPVYRAERPFDLGRAPLPRFGLLGEKPRPRFTVQTSRGCPFACEFCGASRLLGPFREKPVGRLREELAEIRRMDRRATVELADDNTFAGRRSAPELLGTLGDSEIRYFTEADWRIGERPEVLKDLAASGCVQVLVGIESLIHRHKGMGSKAADLSRIIAAVEAIQGSGVAVIGCFIVGSDGEDHESLHALGEFILGSPFADIQLTLQTPFPGTALHQRLRREGRLLPDRDWSSYTLFDLTYRPDRLTPEELETGFRNLVRYSFAAGPSARRLAIRQRVWGRRAGVVA
jgi:radical SAM superfamily enzyme YgiQ (UPF0313 family)